MDVNMESMMSKPDVPKRKRMKSLLIMKVERSIKVEPYIFFHHHRKTIPNIALHKAWFRSFC